MFLQLFSARMLIYNHSKKERADHQPALQKLNLKPNIMKNLSQIYDNYLRKQWGRKNFFFTPH